MLKLLFVLFCLMSLETTGLPAFPGAEGWGADTPGGRGGQVIYVTNTNASGPGSFLAALSTKGPRIIVFSVSGVIHLAPTAFAPNAPYSNVTIAGQTSPGGITLKGKMTSSGSIWWCYSKCNPSKGLGGPFHDGIFRFLRFRGDASNEDGITMTYSNNFIFDHCDFSGGKDEIQDFGHSNDFTLQWCTIANGPTTKGSQNFGTLIAGKEVKHVSMHHNLWAHLIARNPTMHWGTNVFAPDSGKIDYRNNVIYNPVDYSIKIQASSNAGKVILNIVGNYFKDGPATPPAKTHPLAMLSGTARYTSDNYWDRMDSNSKPDGIYTWSSQYSSLYPTPAISTHTSSDGYHEVLDRVGAFPRDPMNARTIQEVRAGTGVHGKIDDPLITSGPPAPIDSDMDGMPDQWENNMGFDKNDASDNTGDHDGDGYTNVEEYINDLALILLGKPPHNVAIEKSSTGFKFPAAGISLFPVPFRAPGQLAINFKGNLSKDSRVSIFNVQGKQVRTLATARRMAWDGRDRAGKPLSPGLYFVRLTRGNRAIAAKSIALVN